MVLKVMSSENLQSSNIGSDKRTSFGVGGLANIFKFYGEIISDSSRNILPPLKPEMLELYSNIIRCCISHATLVNTIREERSHSHGDKLLYFQDTNTAIDTDNFIFFISI